MPLTFKTNHKTETTVIPYLNEFEFTFPSKYKLFKDRGVLAWEYNPFRNFRVANNEYDESTGNLLYRKGQLRDFDTPLLKFDINHPVDILCQPSYDGSVNLILNDDLNPPKLINSRFSALENNTYEIVDRTGSNDTNIYDENQFEIDTSLYKRVTTIVNLEFKGLSEGGNLKVGNYVFYFTYADADGNETDFIEESGIVSCHIGNVNEPKSIRGGLLNENSNKNVNFEISNTDTNYEYLNIYYSRSTSNEDGVETIEVVKILNNYTLRKDKTFVTINGFEDTEPLTTDSINSLYGIAKAVKAQAQCQNMLFFGNIVKPGIDYNNLKDLSLRFYPSIKATNDIGNLEDYYSTTLNPDQTSDFMYYNAYNIYNKTGYWNEEIYRLGITYILADGSLSPVFNVRGRDNIQDFTDIASAYNDIPIYDSITKERKYIVFDEETSIMENNKSPLENTKGVIRINEDFVNSNFKNSSVIGISISADKTVLEELKRQHGVKGFFFVRQKRVPTILAQMITIGGLKLSTLVAEVQTNYYTPVIPLTNNKYFIEGAIVKSSSGAVSAINTDFTNRTKAVTGDSSINTNIALCPDFELNTPYFNTIFAGSDFILKQSDEQPVDNGFTKSTLAERLYQVNEYKYIKNADYSKATIVTVPDATPLVGLKKNTFHAQLTNASIPGVLWPKSDAYKSLGLRGNYGPYLGLDSENLESAKIYNIYIPQYNTNSMPNYFNIRMNDNSPYYAIGNRLDINNYITTGLNQTFYRGDCYICDFTHRMNRNFQDDSLGFTDVFIKPSATVITSTPEGANDIDVGDWNAVKLGHWVTFRVRSSTNLSMRTTDGSNINEKLLSGKDRTFYPYTYIYPDGSSKIPDSFAINKGFASTTSDKIHIEIPDIPAIKNNFDSRIIYSDLHVTDAFKNGYRVFKELNYRDYTKAYGGITKLIDLKSNLLVIFEHAVALVSVNERVLAGQGAGGEVFINNTKVLPETPIILSDINGSQWADSVIKTQKYVYGVDTVTKKIWRTNGQEFIIISDFKIQKFLNDHLSLGERDLLPTIGLRNVKTHYNNSKYDVMFTFYDSLFGFEEKAWNICFNEYTDIWTTFYSWLPSYSASIQNMFFSFDRNTSKNISKAWMTSEGSYIGLEDQGNYPYIKINSINNIDYNTPIGKFFLNNDNEVDELEFRIERDVFRNDLIFRVEKRLVKDIYECWLYPTYNTTSEGITYGPTKDTLYQLNISAYKNDWVKYTNTVTIGTKDAFDSESNTTSWFYKHGQAGSFNQAEKIKPCNWYGKQHPFEFEFVVADKPTYHKLFENLEILGNKESPESFHFEIVGESYNFAEDKKNMYFRQEATKNVYQYNGANILFNDNYLDLQLQQETASNMFYLYQSRVDTFNEIEDSYQTMTSPNKRYENMSGSEIVYEENLNEFKIATHILGSDIKANGRIRGNMNYQEDKWIVQIPSINYKSSNEPIWNVDSFTGNSYPPIQLLNNPLPEELRNGISLSSNEDIPQTLRGLKYDVNELGWFDLTVWPENKQVKIKDKYIKIKIRYTGKNLAVIAAIKTLYNISFA